MDHSSATKGRVTKLEAKLGLAGELHSYAEAKRVCDPEFCVTALTQKVTTIRAGMPTNISVNASDIVATRVREVRSKQLSSLKNLFKEACKTHHNVCTCSGTTVIKLQNRMAKAFWKEALRMKVTVKRVNRTISKD